MKPEKKKEQQFQAGHICTITGVRVKLISKVIKSIPIVAQLKYYLHCGFVLTSVTHVLVN